MTHPPLFPTGGRDGVVLVVDDVERNLQIVGELLTKQRYDVLFATDGETALQRVAARPPDLVLLDVMMPGIDGLEVCRRLQTNPATQDIPIIFVTAADDAEVAVKGLTLGAVDYITNPFHAPELLARVATHVALKQSRDSTRQVINEKNDLMAAVAHDLKNPLSSIRIAGRTLRQGLDGDPRREMAEIIVESCEELLELIEQRLSRNAREATPLSLNPTSILLPDILRAVVQQNRPTAHEKNITLDLRLPDEDLPAVEADYHAAAQIFDNLVSNALKFSNSGSAVMIDVSRERIAVIDQGPGCSPDDVKKLFQPYQRLSARPTAGESSTGLGLSIAHQLVTKMSGRIGYEDTPGGGATFWVTLPVAKA
jgi:signal transduction histidine kinase